jgi:threonyl-tRNA synthetase
MNCPESAYVYKRALRSYRDLPIRYADVGRLHRYERSGVTNGLFRVRSFSQDDAHVFCTEEQVLDEVGAMLDFAFDTYRIFGFEVDVELSTRPEQRIGTDEMWDHSEAALRTALESRGLDFRINEGDGAFYGPKIDLHMTDSLGRSWQLGTVQLDYNFPERFDLTYTGADNAEHRVVMLHRALMGSYERFIGILIEHYAGEFPVWLAPVQATVLPISDRHAHDARAMAGRLTALGVRVEIDDRSESIGKRIREAELQKVPYMLVVGDREVSDDVVAVRRHGEGDVGSESLEAFAQRVAADRPAR